ncbi:hypothetical protein ABZS29_35900 [Kribbella sp. NPDC005582]|uniref:hypothetical protein n=1 Tax=Kribbella sp. NPDC005582 TaxID=3156893 RepID=UPI0033BC2F92
MRLQLRVVWPDGLRLLLEDRLWLTGCVSGAPGVMHRQLAPQPVNLRRKYAVAELAAAVAGE